MSSTLSSIGLWLVGGIFLVLMFYFLLYSLFSNPEKMDRGGKLGKKDDPKSIKTSAKKTATLSFFKIEADTPGLG